jgi:hypothetical protein
MRTITIGLVVTGALLSLRCAGPSTGGGTGGNGSNGWGGWAGSGGGGAGGNGGGGSGGGTGDGADMAVPLGPVTPRGAPYDNASESVHSLSKVLDLQGSYGVALAGGHLLASDAQGGSSFPRTTPLSSKGTITIPQGATVKYAFLWYGGAIFMKPGDNGATGDYTADVGGALDGLADVKANGISFQVGATKYGPFDSSTRLAPNPSTVGSAAQVSPIVYQPHFGTWTNVKESVWANRIDVTGVFAGASGAVDVTVNPPERLDPSGNDATSNGGNPAGNTTYNSCSGAAAWALMVIYEQPGAPAKNLVLMDGDWARAWDYLFFHSGKWVRPKVRIDHAPIRPGAKLYVFTPSGAPAGEALPSSPTCTCGCGGQYTLAHSGLLQNSFFSSQYSDPPECASDPMHRDKTNGPWYTATGALAAGVVGNDWTLFQSGPVYTEFPNLYEGQKAPPADATMPKTDENNADASKDTYGGHPWMGRGDVKYWAHGNGMSVVEVALDPSDIAPGETSSYVYFKGDQKDVFKPQAVVSVKWILFETPM